MTIIAGLVLAAGMGFTMGKDLAPLLIWWSTLLILGQLFLPWTSKFFAHFFDQGYLIAKVMGILFPAFVMWFCAALRLMTFSSWNVLLSVISVMIIWRLVTRCPLAYRKIWSKNWKAFLLEECLFLLLLMGWCVVRGINPDIHGLEKFMDFGFVNAILKSNFMPPSDMWMSGKTINYYYFGHFVCAFLTRLTHLDSALTFNLMVATLASLSFCLAFSLASNALYALKAHSFRRVLTAGAIAALLMTFGANLHPLIYSQFLPAIHRFTDRDIPFKPYSYSDSTRYIGYNPPTHDKTIHEFPAYSFVVADLHGHVSNIPVVLTILSLFLNLIIGASSPKQTGEPPLRWYRVSSICCLIAFFLSICFMTNAWDFPIYLVVGLSVLFLSHWRAFGSVRETLIRTGIQGLQIGILFLGFSSPFFLTFINFSEGLRRVHSHTPIYQLLVLWGYQFFFVSVFLMLLLAQYRQSKQSLPQRTHRYTHFAEWLRRLPASDCFMVLLSLSALGLVLFPELFYVKDIYSSEHYRANTMFKLCFQASILFCLVCGYVTSRFLLKKRDSRLVATGEHFLLLLLVAPMIYPYYAFRQAYNLSIPIKYKSLNGLSYLKAANPDDYQAVQWLNQNLKMPVVVLEANGDSFTDYGRISAFTGFPTILGWYVHELLWHGEEELSARVEDVRTIYESGDIRRIRSILHKYGVNYVVVGKLEREKFKDSKEQVLLNLGKEVYYPSKQTKIVQIE